MSSILPGNLITAHHISHTPACSVAVLCPALNLTKGGKTYAGIQQFILHHDEKALWVTSKEMTSESCLLEDCPPESRGKTSGECLFIINIGLATRGRKNLRAGRPRKTKSKMSDLGRQLCRWREMTGSFIEEESTDCGGYFNTSWGKG